MSGESMRILTINSGSSSLKFALYRTGSSETLLQAGRIERIGHRPALFRVRDAAGQTLIDESPSMPDHDAALNRLFEWLKSGGPAPDLEAVGHRVVHGGMQYDRPHRITSSLCDVLEALRPLAPDHLPHEIKAIRSVGIAYPTLPQVACFDTAFHRQMPPSAQHPALPRELWKEGVLRYGFHGLSYEYIVDALRRERGKTADGRLVIAHLGNGASMAAVDHGRSVDTTMGMTPTGGLVMSSRSGDLDPGMLLYLLQEKGMKPAEVDEMVNQKSGLLGISGAYSDMQELLDREQENPHAAEAVALFCYQAKKFLGALAAVLGGVETLVFTGGIGENAPAVRERICAGMGFLGIALDPTRNRANASVISQEGSPTQVLVMKTNEELMIARQTHALLRGGETKETE
ncbi:MAG: acetate/propionate family kinase [Nitrospirae bacterium]|nr:acetate/propionate family kinase [Candidatus Manganitrophaceae bacterium]